jgi:hypothetical protein
VVPAPQAPVADSLSTSSVPRGHCALRVSALRLRRVPRLCCLVLNTDRQTRRGPHHHHHHHHHHPPPPHQQGRCESRQMGACSLALESRSRRPIRSLGGRARGGASGLVAGGIPAGAWPPSGCCGGSVAYGTNLAAAYFWRPLYLSRRCYPRSYCSSSGRTARGHRGSHSRIGRLSDSLLSGRKPG